MRKAMLDSPMIGGERGGQRQSAGDHTSILRSSVISGRDRATLTKSPKLPWKPNS